MISRRTSRITWLAAAALLAAATPALASEDPVATPPAGNPLPDTLAPVGIPSAGAPASPLAGAPRTSRARGPRIMRVRLIPRRVIRGHRVRLVVSLAHTARVRVVLERTRGRRHSRVRTFNLPERGTTVTLRLSSRLRTGHYRVRVIAVDDQGNRSREVRRSLIVTRSRR
jgi:hypothetical protein